MVRKLQPKKKREKVLKEIASVNFDHPSTKWVIEKIKEHNDADIPLQLGKPDGKASGEWSKRANLEQLADAEHKITGDKEQGLAPIVKISQGEPKDFDSMYKYLVERVPVLDRQKETLFSHHMLDGDFPKVPKKSKKSKKSKESTQESTQSPKQN